jgi:membrane protease YdiL (CAAX protease family)
VGGRVWWWAVLFVVVFLVWTLVPAIPGPSTRDFADFLDSDRGEDFFRGAWGWFAVMVVLSVFNTVLGEELLFRGLLLPRMQGVFGRRDWVANGALFAVYHLHQPWSIPSTLVDGIFLIAYPSRRFQSAWMGIIVHSSAQAFGIIFVLALVLG